MGVRTQQRKLDGETLSRALCEIFLHPWRTLVPVWSWKAAAWSAGIRAITFFVTNLRAGEPKAIRAMVIEGVYAIFAAGTLGASSQRLRCSKPAWATALVVWLLMPAVMILLQFGVHKAAHTPYLGTGLLLSMLLAALGSAFSWYAMRQGVLLGGDESTTVAHDMRELPGVIAGFLMAGPRAVARKVRG